MFRNILLLFSALILFSCSKPINTPIVKEGVIDIRGWNMENIDGIELNGEWEFYWNQFLYSYDFENVTTHKPTYLLVPSTWNGALIDGALLDGKGYATYRLTILHDSTNSELFLKFLDCATSCNLFVDNKLVFSAGKPSTNEKSTIPSYKPEIVHFDTYGTSTEIIVHVSNFKHRKGGLWEKITIGNNRSITHIKDLFFMGELILLGGLLIMALYHFALFVRIPKDKSTLYFALFTLFIALRISTIGERIIYITFDINWYLLTRLEYLSFLISPMFFLLFTYEFFKTIVNKNFVNVIIAITIIHCSTLIFPISIFSYSFVTFQYLIVILGLYVTYIVIKAMRLGLKDSLMFFHGWMVLFATVIIDILIENQIINTIDLTPYGLFAFIFFKSFILASRLTRSLKENEALNYKLNYVNKNLEDILKVRTKQLQNKSDQLEITNQTLMQQKEELTAQTEDLKDAFINISSKNLEIKQQKRQIESANERFRVLFEKSTESHLIFKDTIIDCNDATLKLLKYPEKSYIQSQSFLDFSAPKQSGESTSEEIFNKKIELAQKEGSVRFEWDLISSDNKKITVDCIVNPVSIGGEKVFLAVWHDLTARIMAEKEMKRAHTEVMLANDEIVANNIELERKTMALEQKNEEIEHKNRDITASINYASRIQQAILPPLDYIDKLLPEHFVFYRPRDIVSGDFYWIKQKGNQIFIVVADCTGHGVPGAFMSLLGVAFLSEIINHKNITKASQVLDEMRRSVIDALNQTGKTGEASDGMDMSLCVLQTDKKIMHFAGAHNPLYLIRKTTDINSFVINGIQSTEWDPKIVKFTQKGEYTLLQVKADKMPIGVFIKETDFNSNEIKLEDNDQIYMFSDGYIDQFGGDKVTKFKSSKFKDTLLSICHYPLLRQYNLLGDILENWMGENAQVDDIVVLGFTPPSLNTKSKLNFLSDWSNKTLLFAEDEDLSYIITSGLLASTRIKIIRVANGMQAVEILKNPENKIDIVLMDLNMPVMNGMEATKEMRTFNQQIPILMLTSMGSAQIKTECKIAGCDEFLTKPPQGRELITKLGKFLNA